MDKEPNCNERQTIACASSSNQSQVKVFQIQILCETIAEYIFNLFIAYL